MLKPNIKDLLNAGVHYGHISRKWCPDMAPFIYRKKNGIHIINLFHTIEKLEQACQVLQNMVLSGNKILFVATKKQAREILTNVALQNQMPYISERWLGGLLTNFSTIRKSVKKMNSIDINKKNGLYDDFSKKELLLLNRNRIKLERHLGTISEMKSLPGALFIIDIKRENIAVKEALKLNIPIFGLVDTNSNPRNVNFPIPANDDTSKSIGCIMKYINSAISEGLSLKKNEMEKQKINQN